MPKVALVTLGCPKNTIDSENLGGVLVEAGHEVTDQTLGADVVLVNTCGFIDPARRETVEDVLDLIELKERAEIGGIVLSGCLVARSAGELADALPEVDALVDFAAYPQVGRIVSDVAEGRLEERIFGSPGTRFDPAWWDASLAGGPRIRFGRKPWSYVKIAEGCDRGCTFCAIPLMRGKFRSRPADVIEREITGLVAQGVSEISLVSQDSVMWGRDTNEGDLISLLERLERIEGVRRIRLMYLHPQGVTDRLIDAITASDVVTDYFDLSLQHVSPRVLKGMGRWGGRDRFERMIESIRTRAPLAGIRATFILGFPGESESEAQEVELFAGDADVDWIGTFSYSPEEGTRSAQYTEHIPESTKRERVERVSAVADRTMSRKASSLVGRTLEVLVERLDVENDAWSGRSHREAPEVDGEIRFEAHARPSVGDYVDVEIIAADGADLIGRRVGV